MIADPSALKRIRSAWLTVEKTWDMMSGNISFAFARGGYTSPEFRSATYSLVVLFAFSVLEDALAQIRDEGHFQCSSRMLGKLMTASSETIRWIDFAAVDAARDARNRIAHHQQWMAIEGCRETIAAIKRELTSWGAIEDPT